MSPSLPRLLLYLIAFLLTLGQVAAAFPHELLFSEADMPRIRANTEDPVFRDFWQSLVEADVENDQDFLREALVYLVTGDEARGQAARKHAMEMAREDFWHLFQDADGTPIGFLRTAAKTHRLSLAYDWLYDLFSEEERAEILDAIANKGCQPMFNALYGMKHPESVIKWNFNPDGQFAHMNIDMSRWPEILGKNNFRAVINGGLAMGTIVLQEHDERAAEWKAILLESIPEFNALFKDDGSYDEAVAYVNYAMKYQADAMEAVRREWGIDFFDTANFTGMTDYVLAMYLPSHTYRHGSVSFGDAGASLQSFAAFWIARHARDGLSQYLGLNFSDHYWTSLLYYDPSVRPVPPVADTELVELDLDWIIARTGYAVDDLVVAMRSGEPMNHEHADRNSLLLKAYGEILLSDPGRVTYDNTSEEWVLRTAKGHNMILIDGEGIQYHKGEEGTNESKSSARIVRSGERPGFMFWASDATPGYRIVNPDVASVTRSVVLFPEAPCLVVLDKVTKASEPSAVSARWHIENRDHKGGISAGSGSEFTITRPEARLHVQFAGSGDFGATEGRFDFEDEEKDFRYVDVGAGSDSLDTFLITVATPLRNEEVDPVVELVSLDPARGLWGLRVTKSGSRIVMKIHDNGTLPEFEILQNDFAD
jgi:hypothetical protein